MVQRPKAKPVLVNGAVIRYEKNRAAQKAGLNKAILNVGWGAVRTLIDYKLRERNKVLVLVSPQYSSQECLACGHIDPANRQTQARFQCVVCGYQNNADLNASRVLKQRFLADLRDGTLPEQGKAKKKIAARRKPSSTTPTEERCLPVEPSVRPKRNLGQGQRSRNGSPVRANTVKI
jgi:putative transposase